MLLSLYHQKYANKSDDELALRASVKNKELGQIFDHTQLSTNSEIVRVAVMGCGDRRLIGYHEQYFKELLHRPVEVTTFDITIEHLKESKSVIQHDCALPLPNPPYDITYAHVLLKFIVTDKQWRYSKAPTMPLNLVDWLYMY